MGRRKWTEDYFSKRVRTERERRGWSQADMAKMLTDKGIPMHWTTIAKIEKGDRSVRIDEAAGIADLFEVSLDVLLGRNRDENRSGFVWMAAQLQSLARKSANDVDGLSETLADELPDMRYYAELAKTGSGDELVRSTEMALSALSEARQALTVLAQVPIPAAVTIKRIKRGVR
jgi:transcriptional regulator with XRE-family HTH domain